MLKLTHPFADYAHTRCVGPLVFLAGQGCRDPETDTYPGTQITSEGQLSAYDAAVQTKGVLDNVERALHSVGLDRQDLIDVTVFLTSMDDFAAMNGVWNEWFQGMPLPTRTTVAVKKLPGFNQVEMKAIASRERTTS